jgi:hypothetical protein
VQQQLQHLRPPNARLSATFSPNYYDRRTPSVIPIQQEKKYVQAVKVAKQVPLAQEGQVKHEYLDKVPMAPLDAPDKENQEIQRNQEKQEKENQEDKGVPSVQGLLMKEEVPTAASVVASVYENRNGDDSEGPWKAPMWLKEMGPDPIPYLDSDDELGHQSFLTKNLQENQENEENEENQVLEADDDPDATMDDSWASDGSSTGCDEGDVIHWIYGPVKYFDGSGNFNDDEFLLSPDDQQRTKDFAVKAAQRARPFMQDITWEALVKVFHYDLLYWAEFMHRRRHWPRRALKIATDEFDSRFCILEETFKIEKP